MSTSDLHKKLVSQGTRGRKNYSPIPWDQFFDSKIEVPTEDGSFNVYLKGTEGPILFLIHGGGYSGLTWACFAKSISRIIKCRIVAPDLRCHGKSGCRICFIHMGGAFAVHALCENVIPSFAAVAVIDVVEGSAMDALQGMKNVLRCRPSRFESVEKAVEWCIRSGYTSNLESARVSMPSQIKPVAVKESFTWRIDLSKTEPYWQSWFSGLSQKFLSITVPKLLLLAGIDRLDKELTIGHMQGKFQMIVLPRCGHAVQEDSPDRLADTVAMFLVRNRLAEAIADFHPVLPGC
ncbi:unnamed protein product [Soboliphyme baturini]|uniref:Protein phosphatase methylesterase 1 n=1 Tax=Soboliphyme baturini TaxID=241478 RepID=A0A183INI0_9BILA|nr:unnamed protein product [Soboliphyme baturini]